MAPHPSGTGPAGAVLTGGASRRMGRDKALIERGGRALAARAVDALAAAGLAPVLCVGGDLGALAAEGCVAVPDAHPGEGPLGGLLTAFDELSEADVVVVLSCDLDAPRADAVVAVVAGLADGADVAVPVSGGRRQWLHAAWRVPTCGPSMRRAFDAGERAVHRAVADLVVADVAGIDPAALRDLDRPEDLAQRLGHDDSH